MPRLGEKTAARRRAERSRGGGSQGQQTPVKGAGRGVESPGSGGTGSSLSPTLGGLRGSGGKEGENGKGDGDRGVYEVLRYIRTTFDDEEVLDSVPLEAAGNPGAWHAWRTHRIKIGKIVPTPGNKEKTNWHEGLSDGEESSSSAGAPGGYQRLAGGTSAPMAARRPGEWNWDGVWEVRVKRGIENSLSEAVLYGGSAGDDLVRFLHMEGEEVETIKENIRRSVESVEPVRRGSFLMS